MIIWLIVNTGETGLFSLSVNVCHGDGMADMGMMDEKEAKE